MDIFAWRHVIRHHSGYGLRQSLEPVKVAGIQVFLLLTACSSSACWPTTTWRSTTFSSTAHHKQSIVHFPRAESKQPRAVLAAGRRFLHTSKPIVVKLGRAQCARCTKQFNDTLYSLMFEHMIGSRAPPSFATVGTIAQPLAAAASREEPPTFSTSLKAFSVLRPIGAI